MDLKNNKYRIYVETLKWINQKRREARQLELARIPEGGCEGDNCPVYNALSECGVTWVARSFYTLAATTKDGTLTPEKAYNLPEEVSAFIKEHDQNDAYKLRTH